jgi:hypothetical protein
MIAMALAISMTTMRVNMRTMMVMAATILVTTSLEVLQEVEATPLIEE